MLLIALTVALNYEEIKKYQQRITKIKHFINKHNWEAINFPSEKDDWKKFEKNNVTIALNVLHAKKDVSKHNSNFQKTSYSFNNFKWRKMALSCSKNLSALLRGIASKKMMSFII